MSIATLTQKGQTTIPIQIRTYLDIHPGDKLEFFIDNDGRVVVSPLTVEVTQLKGLLLKPKKIISIEKMNQAIKTSGGQHEGN
ncbi:MAG: AbrB family transcriptional regulator [Gammaproteobacteria bacterium RIFCSPHIGHO2_12_FULL_42_10]|nr:MAG: AbrB family transcriptional regulator [Gammaproteobacteria bacterium RIFCSPHIGHO2_12_FULL_42_10]